MKKTQFLRQGIARIAAATALLGTTLATITMDSSNANATSTSPLSILATPIGPFTDNFNPFYTSSPASQEGTTGMIYEPLMEYDVAKAGVVYPWLATKWQFSDGGKKLTFAIRKGVTWSDGAPFSANDVAYTFNLIKKVPALNTQGVTFSSVKSTSATSVVMTFATAAYGELFTLSKVLIVPAHVWSKVPKPATFTDPQPVGTGPYVLASYSSQDVQLKARTSYWQAGEPKVQALDYPAYSSNTSADLALESGQLNWTSLFISNYKKLFLDKSIYNGIFNAPVGNWNLCPNITVAPMNNVNVRRAVSMSIDRSAITTQGESGYYDTPATSATGLITPNFAAEIASKYKNSILKYDPTAAKALLESQGFKAGSNGMLNMPNGQPFTLSLVLPSSFTDWVTDATLLQEQMAKAGINLTIDGVSYAQWSNDQATGNFGLTFCGTWLDASPDDQLSVLLNSKLTAPTGKVASGDFERWNNAATDAALNAYNATNSPAVQQAAINTLEGVMVNDVPVIPLMFQAGGGEFTSKNWVGWPSPSNPYEVDAPGSSPWNLVVVLHLKPRS